nr:putative reverse transcriptase domain-containing protein [Tanacetum cinerariifolium]
MRQRSWVELFSDYDCEIRNHPGKANVVANALSRKERVKPKRVWAMAMTIQFGVKRMILAAQSEAFKEENATAEMLCDVKTLIMDEAHASRLPRSSGGYDTNWVARSMAEIGESRLIGPELVQEMTDKVVLIKEKLKAARDHQKSYADNRRKLLEFEVLLNGSDEYTYLDLEWIGWVRLLSFGIDRMGTPTQYWNGSDGYAY